MALDLTRLPVIPHEQLGADCCGCLIVEVRGAQATVLCNECGAIIHRVPVEEVESVVAKLAETDAICSARCTHCGAVNTFPGWTSVSAFTCSECGQGVGVDEPVQ